jgi:hypothetical protein
MIKKNSLKTGIINEEKNDDQEEVQLDYTTRVFSTSLFLTLKLLFFCGLRYLIFYLEDFHKNDVPFSNIVLIFFVFFYLFLLIFYGLIWENIDDTSLLIINFIGFICENLIIINVEFNAILMLSFSSLALFYFLTAILTKIRKSYGFIFNLFILFFIGTATNVLFVVFFRSYFNEEKMGYFRYNIFLGSYVYGVWTIFYFYDFVNRKNISKLRVSFEIGKDFVFMLGGILKEIKSEFYLEETNSSSFNY